ncbi:MAG: hypothetical protein EPN22_06215 [Nitrospirae bacterium]|nr:MAG: hypothetical protein EPN22_06215 [Nitrospirota bacterium]
MSYKAAAIIIAAVLFWGLALGLRIEAEGFWDFPPNLPPEEYGNLIINRTSEKNGVKAVTFSHWSHRRKHTCRVCHSELEFNMKLNTTEITEESNKAGRFCGACHNGKLAFGHGKADCEKCHNGNRSYGKGKFSELSHFPKTVAGNKIDWVKALEKGLFKPSVYLKDRPSDFPFEKKLLLQAEWLNIPPAVFPHKEHIQWLDCNNCHPDIFNIKQKTTKHFSMPFILGGQFCGVCHLSVAFPLNDCKRCHPDMTQ